MRKATVALGLLAGVVTIIMAIIMHAAHQHLGHPWSLGWAWLDKTHALSAVGIMGGMGIVMIVGGLVALRSRAIGGIIVVGAAIVGLAYAYNHGVGADPARVRLLWWWAAPLVFAWATGIVAGYSLHGETTPYGAEKPAAAAPPVGAPPGLN
jgi:hypothetical protein